MTLQWIGKIGMELCPTFTTSDGLHYEGALHPVAVRDKVDEGRVTFIDMNLPIPDIIKQLQAVESESIIRRSFNPRSYIYSLYHGHYENEHPLDHDYCDTCSVHDECPRYNK